MAHLLILELPGGNDTDLIDAAIARGDSFCLLTAQLALYRQQPAVWNSLGAAVEHIEVPGFAAADVDRAVLAAHARRPFEALLCLIDIRLVEAARLARLLGLRHLNPASAALLRDKVSVRRRLAERGIAQPGFALATSNAELQAAVQQLGLPVLIKPADGYGSQNIVVLRTPHDLDPLLTPLHDMLPSRADYGLGVHANDRLLVERYLHGRFVGVDTLTANGRHTVLGLHEKHLFAPPSFAMRGSTFTPNTAQHPTDPVVQRYVGALLDAVGFDWGAAHTELMLTDDGPQLVEINARLVGAKIPRLVNHALGRSVHAELIALHLGEQTPAATADAAGFGVIRWVVAQRPGRLAAVHLPAWTDKRIRSVEMLKQPGDWVGPPFENADRIGYVMVCGSDRGQAEQLADDCVAQATVLLQQAPATSAQAEAQAH